MRAFGLDGKLEAASAPGGHPQVEPQGLSRGLCRVSTPAQCEEGRLMGPRRTCSLLGSPASPQNPIPSHVLGVPGVGAGHHWDQGGWRSLQTPFFVFAPS